MIRYKDILAESVVDGLGIRAVAFLQGCPRHCHGCHNPELLPFEGGEVISEMEFADLLLAKLTPLHQGITFSGGDPLAQSDALLKVLFLIKHHRPDIDIWLYTGFLFEEVKQLPVMGFIDVLVDGPFDEKLKDLRLAFRGSSNQRIIDVQKSLASGRAVVLKLDRTSAVS